jgi:DNA polymerase III subunit delta
MKKMLINIFFGDQYHVRRCLSDFLAGIGLSGADIVKIEGENISEAVIKSEAMSVSLLATPRAILVENFLSTKKIKLSDDFYSFLNNYDNLNYILFLEEETVSSTLLKKINQENIAVIDCVGKGSLSEWVIKEAKKQGIGLTKNQANLIENLLGHEIDFYRLQGELEKLATYEQAQIDEHLIKKLYKKIDPTASIFSLTDAFGERKRANIIKALNDLTNEDGNSVYILSMIVRQFKNIILAKELKSKGLTDEEIAKKLSIHPFVAKKSVSQGSRYTLTDLKKIYSMLVAVDASIKTGGDINTELSLMSYWVGGEK